MAAARPAISRQTTGGNLGSKATQKPVGKLAPLRLFEFKPNQMKGFCGFQRVALSASEFDFEFAFGLAVRFCLQSSELKPELKLIRTHKSS